MARRQIAAVVDSDSVYITFHRRTKISTPANGWKWGPEETLDPQEVTLIPFKRRMTDFLVNTELGEVPDLPYVLVGSHDLDIQTGDWFMFQGSKFEVKTIDFKRGVRTAAEADYYGKGKTDGN